jgi:hypothetical protein
MLPGVGLEERFAGLIWIAVEPNLHTGAMLRSSGFAGRPSVAGVTHHLHTDPAPDYGDVRQMTRDRAGPRRRRF